MERQKASDLAAALITFNNVMTDLNGSLKGTTTVTDNYIKSLAERYSGSDVVASVILPHISIAKLTFPQGVIDNFTLLENAEINKNASMTVDKLLSRHLRGTVLTYLATQNNSYPQMKLENVSPSIDTVARRFLIVAAICHGVEHLETHAV